MKDLRTCLNELGWNGDEDVILEIPGTHGFYVKKCMENSESHWLNCPAEIRTVKAREVWEEDEIVIDAKDLGVLKSFVKCGCAAVAFHGMDGKLPLSYL